MIIFWRLILAHLLSDFIFQTKELVVWKRNSWLGILTHSVIHFLVYILFTYNYLSQTWLEFGSVQINGWSSIIIITIIHFFIDFISRTNIKAKKQKTLYFLCDQFSHYLVIFILSAPNLFANTGSLFAEKYVMVFIFLLLTTHFTTYLIYSLESDLFDTKLSLPNFDEKYLTISYRTILYLLFLFPGYLWLAFVAIWFVVGIVVKRKRLIDISRFSFCTSVILTAIFGILARMIIYYG